MSIILNIDTATDSAHISIAKEGTVLAEMSNSEQKDHGSFLQQGIANLLKTTGILLNDIDAVAVSAGPGSYTGLRVGMASAKGLSFALNKPLLSIGSLEILAFATLDQTPLAEGTLVCPMIDARRMEVFTSIYDKEMNIMVEASALILGPNSFANWLLKYKLIFSGSGAAKWSEVCQHSNAQFVDLASNSLAMSKLSYQKYLKKTFSDVAYVEPLYLKEFYSAGTPT